MIRKTISLTALLSFIATVITSFVLYIAPQGRVAYWADWKLLGLDKTQWGNLHINLGTLFLLALCLHVYYNWKPITAYLSKAKKLVLVTKEGVLALGLTLLVGLGTYYGIAPFSSFLDLSEQLKDVAAKTYGEPPYGHAELSSLASLASKLGLQTPQVLEALTKAGYPAENANVTLRDLSRRYGVSPQRIYQSFEPKQDTSAGLPPTPPPGSGNLALSELCTRYNLDAAVIQRGLQAKGITAEPTMTIKQIGQKNGTSPTDVYAAIRDVAAEAH